MSGKWFAKIALLMAMMIMTASVMAACGKKEQAVPNPAEAAEAAEKEVEAAEKEVEAAAEQGEEILQEFTGEMDLAGQWEDEVSQRASMDVTANEDGSYNILVHWGGSATETAIWEIHGTYDPVSGMLSYEDGAYSIHTVGEDGKETVSGEETTKGTFMKEGDKLRWSDSKNSDDGLFVKAE